MNTLAGITELSMNSSKMNGKENYKREKSLPANRY